MIESNRAGRREATLPATTLLELIAAARAAGPDRLRAAGLAAGRSLSERMAGGQGSASARSTPSDVFWRRTSELFSSRGWGTLEHATAEPNVGELRLRDSVEADAPGAHGCDFTAAMLQGLLEAVAGGRLEVREMACSGRGAGACRFLFGTPAALDAAVAGAAS